VINTTAQDAPGSTNASPGDLQAGPFLTAPRSNGRSSRSKRPWTLPAPWTRRRAHRALENGGPFPTAPTAILVLFDQGKQRQADLRQGQRPASDNYRAPLRSPASSFAGPSPAEMVVANRQK
jgi:hypothetical protein